MQLWIRFALVDTINSLIVVWKKEEPETPDPHLSNIVHRIEKNIL